MRRDSWWEMAPALFEDSAPFASLDCLKARVAPAHPRAQPEPLGSLPRPQQPASGRTEDEAFPLSTPPGAITQWADGASLYVNAGRFRNAPSARYRNRFWAEPDGSVLLSWFPGRGHEVTGAAVAALVGSGVPLLLFCRRAPSHEYLFCGQLQPCAIALPESDDPDEAEAARDDDQAGGLPVWRMAVVPWQNAQTGEAGEAPSQAQHVIFRLLDAAALLPPHEDALGQVLGGRAVEPERPAHYVGE